MNHNRHTRPYARLALVPESKVFAVAAKTLLFTLGAGVTPAARRAGDYISCNIALNRRTPVLPRARAFELCRERDYSRLVAGASDNLQRERQARLAESVGDRDSRLAGRVEREGERDPRVNFVGAGRGVR